MNVGDLIYQLARNYAQTDEVHVVTNDSPDWHREITVLEKGDDLDNPCVIIQVEEFQ